MGYAQNLPFELDASFQPNVDFRDAEPFYQNGRLVYQQAGVLGDIWEDSSTGKLYIAGNFIFVEDSIRYAGNICLNKDGSLFKDFNTPFESMGQFFPINDSVFFTIGQMWYSLVDTLGKVNLGWMHNLYNSVRCLHGSFIYFYEDGSSLWSNFTPNPNVDGCKIILPPDTFPHRHIVKVDPEGKWDSTFVIDADYGGLSFFPYDSNRILMCAPPRFIINYGTHTVNGIWRTFLDGTLDTTFHAPISDEWADGDIVPVVEKDGKIFITGYFLLEGNNTYHHLIRLNENGSLDTTFMNHEGPTDSAGNFSSVTAIAPTEDGGYLVGGIFNKYQGHKKNNIAKITYNGAVEPQHFTSSGPSNHVLGNAGFIREILPSAFGGYYVIGNFRDWNGQPTGPIIRLHGLNVGLEEHERQVQKLKVFPNPAKESIRFYGIGSSKIENLLLIDVQGKTLEADFWETSSNTYETNTSKLKPGMYFLKVVSEGEVAVGKFIKH